MTELRLSDLSAARQTFFRRCQGFDHVTIRGLEVHGGEPVFGPKTEILYDLKLDSDEAPRPEQALTDFVVSKEIRRLVSILDFIHTGAIEHIEVRAGVPRRIIFKTADPARA